MSLGLLHCQGRGMDWQRHLLVYHWQLFLPNWQTGDESCLLGFVWGVWPGGMLRGSAAKQSG